MSELRVVTVAFIVLIVLGGVIPLIIGSVKDTSDVELDGIINYTYSKISGGVDLTGSFDTEADDGTIKTYFEGAQIMSDEFPVIVKTLIFIFLFILVYAIVKALPFT